MPKVLLLIIFGLLGFPLTGYSGHGEIRQQRHVRQYQKSPEIKKAAAIDAISANAAATDYFLDCDKPVLEHQTGKVSVTTQIKAPGDQVLIVPSVLSVTGARYSAQLKAQASGYLERSFDFYGLLIYPHHGFW